MATEKFEEAQSWQEARKLEQIVYCLTTANGFRPDRGLVGQIQEAAVACMGHIAEAHSRHAFEERCVLDIAFAASKEVQSHLYVALDQDYIAPSDFDAAYRQADVVGQLVRDTIAQLDRLIANRSRRGAEAPPPP